MHKITLNVSLDMHGALRQRSQATGKPMTSLVREAIVQFLAMDAAVRHVKDGEEANQLE
jgi:predicted DNA-binding protein